MFTLESRRAAEIERLIRAHGGVPFIAPSMREIPLEKSPEAFDFAVRLLKPGGDFGVGRPAAPDPNDAGFLIV